jgi:hypothetical protein
MAVKNIAVTDTLETFRTEFNDLAANDFGDIANLDGSLSSTNLVDAMNETLSVATSTAGFTIRDSSSTGQIIGGGDTLTVLGTSNEIEAVVSATDTLTIGLPNDVTITNNLTASGSTHTLGTIEISGNTIRSTDSTRININDTFRANSFETTTGLLNIDETTGYPRIQSTRGDRFLIFDAIPTFEGDVIFEGSTPDGFETTLTVVDPTADRTITIPNETGTLITTSSSGVVTGAMIGIDTVAEANMANDAIGQDQLKSVVNLQILNSSGGVLKSLYGAGA